MLQKIGHYSGGVRWGQMLKTSHLFSSLIIILFKYGSKGFVTLIVYLHLEQKLHTGRKSYKT